MHCKNKGVMATATLKMVSLLHPTQCHCNTLEGTLRIPEFLYSNIITGNVLWTFPVIMLEYRNSGMHNFYEPLWDILYVYIYMYNLLLRIS